MPKRKTPPILRRMFPAATVKQLQTLTRVIGLDGIWTMFTAIEEGQSAEEVMRNLKPFFDRYVEAHGEQPNTRRDFYRRLERGEV
jgi:3-hydroxyacyl-CoA dehydrogenase